jgi:hypothetical protein
VSQAVKRTFPVPSAANAAIGAKKVIAAAGMANLLGFDSDFMVYVRRQLTLIRIIMELISNSMVQTI